MDEHIEVEDQDDVNISLFSTMFYGSNGTNGASITILADVYK